MSTNVPQLATSNDSPPRLVIEPQRGWHGIAWRELWKYRELLYFLTSRDIKVRYKQTVLGASWAILQPVMTTLVFSIFFGRLGGLDRNVSIPYPIFVYTGILPWTFFAAAVSQAATSLLGNANLISKVYFPRLLVPSSAIAAATVDFVISSLVMAALMVWYFVPPSPGLILLPGLVIALWCAALGVGAALAALVVMYRDFRHVITFVLQIWMFASPVAYPLDIVPEQWRLLYSLNPMAGLIHGFRVAILGETLELGCVVVSVISSATVFLLGLMYFVRSERRLADIV